jgi:hypothetical protein
VNLEQLIERLDEDEQWDRVLSGGEQPRVGFARVILHKPDWVFLDEATAALDDESQDSMMRILIEDMPSTAVLSVAHRPGLEDFHGREPEFIRTEDGGDPDQGCAPASRATARPPAQALGEFRRTVTSTFGRPGSSPLWCVARHAAASISFSRRLRDRRSTRTPPTGEVVLGHCGVALLKLRSVITRAGASV